MIIIFFFFLIPFINNAKIDFFKNNIQFWFLLKAHFFLVLFNILYGIFTFLML